MEWLLQLHTAKCWEGAEGHWNKAPGNKQHSSKALQELWVRSAMWKTTGSGVWAPLYEVGTWWLSISCWAPTTPSGNYGAVLLLSLSQLSFCSGTTHLWRIPTTKFKSEHFLCHCASLKFLHIPLGFSNNNKKSNGVKEECYPIIIISQMSFIWALFTPQVLTFISQSLSPTFRSFSL